MKIRTTVVALLGILLFNSCAPVVRPTPTLIPTSIPSVTATLPPTRTATPQHPANSPTPQLSPVSTENGIPVFEINEFTVDHKYCSSPEVFLSTSDARGFNDDEIARKLMELWLDYFNTPQAPNYCRVDGYVIDRVYYDERTPFLPLEPRGDFIRIILFSIKLVQYPTFWAPWAGDVDKQNWLHTGHAVAVFRSDDGYAMKFANP
jgi:hypothetical protein